MKIVSISHSLLSTNHSNTTKTIKIPVSEIFGYYDGWTCGVPSSWGDDEE